MTLGLIYHIIVRQLNELTFLYSVKKWQKVMVESILVAIMLAISHFHPRAIKLEIT